jgi:hypothetical protein
MSARIRAQETQIRFTVDGKDQEGPTWLKVLRWTVTPKITNEETDFVGEDVPDGDTLLRGYNFSCETQEGDSKADQFVASMQANQDAFLPPPTIMMTVFKQYREPGAGAITHVYSDVSMKVDEQSAEGKSYVTYKFSGFAKRRSLLT